MSYRTILLLTVLLSACSNRIAQTTPLATVPYLDIERYQGRWYELAKIPNRFQAHCTANAVADYTLREDGRIDVRNSCDTAAGERDVADGLARVVDTVSKAKLEVSFVSLFGIRLFWGDYWVLGMGDEYDYAVIGTPGRNYGWVLSRTPSLSAAQWQRIEVTLAAQGYELTAFVRSPQQWEP